MGDSVNATTPETSTAPASVKANSLNSAPVSPPWMPTGVYTAASVMVMATIGPTSSRAPFSAAWNGDSPVQVAVDVLHHDDSVVHDQADRRGRWPAASAG